MLLNRLNILLLICTLLGNSLAKGQDTIPPREKHQLNKIDEGVSLTETQRQQANDIFQEHFEKISGLQQEIDSLESFSEETNHFYVQIAVLSEKKKEVLRRRDLAMQDILSDDQLEVYLAHFSTIREETRLFGLHDNANCKLCNR